jgi:arsenate reductase
MLLVSEQPYNVLFLCTGNSARSILAEVMMNHLSQGKFMAYSAGSHPRGSVHPFTLDTLQRLHLPITGLRSKSWEEFAQPGTPQLDFVFTVCDDAAGEVLSGVAREADDGALGRSRPGSFSRH